MPSVILTIMVLLFLTKSNYNQEIEDGLEGSFEDYNNFYGNFKFFLNKITLNADAK